MAIKFGADMNKWFIAGPNHTETDKWHVCPPIIRDDDGKPVEGWYTRGGQFDTGAEALAAFAARSGHVTRLTEACRPYLWRDKHGAIWSYGDDDGWCWANENDDSSFGLTEGEVARWYAWCAPFTHSEPAA